MSEFHPRNLVSGIGQPRPDCKRFDRIASATADQAVSGGRKDRNAGQNPMPMLGKTCFSAVRQSYFPVSLGGGHAAR
ncbi:hypothetical protein, partial [Rhodovulum sulfidophilum]|uniref:hypothetical protein n=1 Tax=Rhodovulum sulfidophilum TaxID=35806 RepID=UPI001F2848DB